MRDANMMIQPGTTIENPITGDRIVFRKTAQETEGQLLKFDNFHRTGGIGPPPHIHPLQEERFLVKAGTFGVQVNGEEKILNVGESITVPPGTPHAWRNAGEDELLVETEFRPALHFAELIETIFALGQSGEMSSTGVPNMLQLSVTLSEYAGEYFLAGPPIFAQKLMYRILGSVGRMRGYGPRYPYPY
jgi:quercetin dioxygenase-like cupin family protein